MFRVCRKGEMYTPIPLNMEAFLETRLVVVGSLNIVIVVKCTRRPRPGETVTEFFGVKELLATDRKEYT